MARPATFCFASWPMLPVKDRWAYWPQDSAGPGAPGASWQLLPTRKFGLKITATAARATAEMPNTAA